MKNTLLSKLLIISTAIILTACGGGGDSGSSTAAPTYGSIYVTALLGGSINANYSSPTLAAEAGKARCVSAASSAYSASTCTLVLEYGQNMCGALSRSANTATTGAYGVASASTAAVAESNAIANCKTRGGLYCTLAGSACNGTGTPSSNSITGAVAKDSSDQDLNEILQTQ